MGIKEYIQLCLMTRDVLVLIRIIYLFRLTTWPTQFLHLYLTVCQIMTNNRCGARALVIGGK